jgi:hypothetical protein
MGLALSYRTIEKYFAFLWRLDTNSKKRLIIKLTESIDPNSVDKNKPQTLFGAWEDSRDSDDIIEDILAARVNSDNLPEL